jgi:hypothetical protein
MSTQTHQNPQKSAVSLRQKTNQVDCAPLGVGLAKDQWLLLFPATEFHSVFQRSQLEFIHGNDSFPKLRNCGDPNGIRTRFGQFASLRDCSVTLRSLAS